MSTLQSTPLPPLPPGFHSPQIPHGALHRRKLAYNPAPTALVFPRLAPASQHAPWKLRLAGEGNFPTVEGADPIAQAEAALARTQAVMLRLTKLVEEEESGDWGPPRAA